jgi:hypothetical protein
MHFYLLEVLTSEDEFQLLSFNIWMFKVLIFPANLLRKYLLIRVSLRRFRLQWLISSSNSKRRYSSSSTSSSRPLGLRIRLTNSSNSNISSSKNYCNSSRPRSSSKLSKPNKPNKLSRLNSSNSTLNKPNSMLNSSSNRINSSSTIIRIKVTSIPPLILNPNTSAKQTILPAGKICRTRSREGKLSEVKLVSVRLSKLNSRLSKPNKPTSNTLLSLLRPVNRPDRIPRKRNNTLSTTSMRLSSTPKPSITEMIRN